jgi:hypothetical protein
LAAIGSATPAMRCTSARDRDESVPPCTFHAVAIVASLKKTAEPAAP